jgi:uncharacterized protein with PIN domain
MAKITGFKCISAEDKEIVADLHGNNLALLCPNCLNPILMVTLPNQRGSDRRHAANCKFCGRQYWAEIREDERQVHIHGLPSTTRTV